MRWGLKAVIISVSWANAVDAKAMSCCRSAVIAKKLVPCPSLLRYSPEAKPQWRGKKNTAGQTPVAARRAADEGQKQNRVIDELDRRQVGTGHEVFLAPQNMDP
jgi:hypothetical protein